MGFTRTTFQMERTSRLVQTQVSSTLEIVSHHVLLVPLASLQRLPNTVLKSGKAVRQVILLRLGCARIIKTLK